jgi:hypothetical protein
MQRRARHTPPALPDRIRDGGVTMNGGTSQYGRPFDTPFLTLTLDPEPAHADLLEQLQGTYRWYSIGPQKEPALRARLAVPSGETLFRFDVWEPLGWEGYRFALVATDAATTPHDDTAPLFGLIPTFVS